MANGVGIVERVAKAMVDEFYGGGLWDSQGDTFRKRWLQVARAAVGAIKEPTDEMASEAFYNSDHTLEEVWGSPSPEQGCKNIYSAMIDAALKDNQDA